MFCGGRLRLGRTAVEAEVGVGYEERPLLSLVVMRVATSMDGGVLNDGGAGSGGCRSCRSDMACRGRDDLLRAAKDDENNNNTNGNK